MAFTFCFFLVTSMAIAVLSQGNCSHHHAVSINEQPWIADLDGCTGTIIGEYWILTAAHCAYDNYTGQHRAHQYARVGSPYGDKGRRVSIDESIEHPKYDLYNSIQYDFLLLRLSKPLVFGHRVRPAKFAGAYGRDLAPGVRGSVLGFGHYSDNGSHTSIHDSPKRLIRREVALISVEECRNSFQDIDLHAVTMCARADDNQCDERGGPLIVDGAVVGVAASVSEHACSPDDPIPFASVPLVRDWIRFNMNRKPVVATTTSTDQLPRTTSATTWPTYYPYLT